MGFKEVGKEHLFTFGARCRPGGRSSVRRTRTTHPVRRCQMLKRASCDLQEVGKENLFIFGMDESEVPAWREEKRAAYKDYDPRFMKAIDMIKSGTFGDEEYFEVGHCPQ